MSVLYSRDEADLLWMCAGCGHRVAPPCVHWCAGELDLVWHPRCAARVGAHLLKDSRECELAADPQERWHRRAMAVSRYRLRDEEAVA